jgi:hypothetical protein
MILTPQPSESGAVMQFKLQGFPEEAAVISALERVYRGDTASPRQFEVYNTFSELIFTGSVDSTGKVEAFSSKDRRDIKYVEKKD